MPGLEQYPPVMIRTFFSFLLCTFACPGDERPNVVILLADDLGYGEVSCLNPEGKIPTPNLDQLAKDGMTFTDAHSGSSVCTPTRYGLLTGRYCWRSRLQNGVLTGGESLFAKDRYALPKLLKTKEYHTCIIGKWHLGMKFDGKKNVAKKIPVGAKVTHGPLDRGGFDEFHGFHHARQMGLWIDNDKLTRHMEHVDMLPDLTECAVNYIASRKGKTDPFFLYVPWNSPHSPVVPNEKWKGKSGINDHADFVMQTDDSCGQVLKALEDHGFKDNTIVIFSCDNGTSPATSGLPDLKKAGHNPSGKLRGMKADFWDGGHRVPFLIRWPGKVKAGSTNHGLTCLNDIYATLAEITDVTYPETEGVDSISFLPSLTGESGKHARTDVVHHSYMGLFAIRQGPWKLLCGPGSGGWGKPRPHEAIKQGKPMVQLYHMEKDLGESKNLHLEHPEKVKELRALLEKQIADGRTTPGPRQTNDVDQVVIDKMDKSKRKKKSGR